MSLEVKEECGKSKKLMKKVILMSIDENELRNLYIEENKSRKQIAIKFGLSESSIKFYLKNLEL